LFAGPVAHCKSKQEPVDSMHRKATPTLKMDYPEGSPPVPTENFIFSSFLVVKGYRSARDGRQKKRKEKIKAGLPKQAFLFLIEREKKREKRKIKAGFF
jgi:hypothetical protein